MKGWQQSTCVMVFWRKARRRFERNCGHCLPTLEDGSILDDETLKLCADHLKTGFHVAARRHQVALLHLLGTAGWAFGLANLKVWAWQDRKGRERREIFISSLLSSWMWWSSVSDTRVQRRNAAEVKSFFRGALFHERYEPGKILPSLQAHSFKTKFCTSEMRL